MMAFLLANHFLLKLFLAPCIISMATLIARRWGERIGGLVVGLPLTSAPVSIFFALEQGRQFAAHAAQEAVAGLIPVAFFCIAYAFSARRLPWYGAALVGVSLYLASVVSMSLVRANLIVTLLLVAATLLIAIVLVGSPPPSSQPMPRPWWDLPARMAVATVMLVLITSLASFLGSTWSGLLSPFPIFTFVMVAFSHSQGGALSAFRIVRGVLVGLFSYVAFFLVVNLFVISMPLGWVYALAAALALGINGLSLIVMIRQQKGIIPEKQDSQTQLG